MVNEVLEAFALKELQSRNVRIPRNWNSVRTYERLVEKGVARECEEPNPLLRSFALVTGEEGRQ
jgi:hypothetical protein